MVARTSASVMFIRRRSQPGQSLGAGAAAGEARPSKASTRFLRLWTSLSSARMRSSGACAAAALQASASSSAMQGLERIAQPRRDTVRIAATGDRRRADAVLAEVAQAGGVVVDLRDEGDEVEVAVEEILVRERPRLAFRLRRAARGTPVLRRAVRHDALVDAEGAHQVDRARLLVVGSRAIVDAVLAGKLPRAKRVLGGD